MRVRFLSNYFGFNKQQRRGLLILACISFVLFVIRFTYPCFIKPAPIVVKKLAALEHRLDSLPVRKEVASDSYKKQSTEVKSATLFDFDPNRVDREQLLQLGFSEKTAGIFLKFRAKGFVFRKKEDLKKVYGISEGMYQKLEPHIVIAQQPDELNKRSSENIQPRQESPKTNVQIELNGADTTALSLLPGIGRAYALRIIKYRTLLGGFVESSQLKEVYGISAELFDKIKSSIIVNPSGITQLDLNKSEFKVLSKHPYIGYELTKTVFEWRKKTILTPENFKDILNDPARYSRLLPYLTFGGKN